MPGRCATSASPTCSPSWPGPSAAARSCAPPASTRCSRAATCSSGSSRELLPLAAEEQIAVIPYNALAGGLLTGKHASDRARGGTRHARQRPGPTPTATGTNGARHRRGAATLAEAGDDADMAIAGCHPVITSRSSAPAGGTARRRGARRRVAARARPQGPPRRAHDRVPLRRRRALAVRPPRSAHASDRPPFDGSGRDSAAQSRRYLDQNGAGGGAPGRPASATGDGQEAVGGHDVGSGGSHVVRDGLVVRDDHDGVRVRVARDQLPDDVVRQHLRR